MKVNSAGYRRDCESKANCVKRSYREVSQTADVGSEEFGFRRLLSALRLGTL